MSNNEKTRWDYLVEKESVVVNVDAFREGVDLIYWLRMESYGRDDAPTFIRENALHAFRKHIFDIEYLYDCLRGVAYEIEHNGVSTVDAFTELTSHWAAHCNATDPEEFRVKSPEEIAAAHEDFIRRNPQVVKMETFEDFMRRNPHIVPGSGEAYFASILCE